MIKRLSCVLRLCDSLNSYPILNSEAGILVDGFHYKAQYKSGGYFVLIDLAEGVHYVEITSWKFQKTELEINVKYDENPAEMIIYVMLNPGKAHPAVSHAFFISGKFPFKTDFFVLNNTNNIKIAEDNIKCGNKRVKMFCEKSVILPSMFLVEDEKNSEFIIASGMEGEYFILSNPLKYSHARSTRITALVKYTTDESGHFLAASGNSEKLTLLVMRDGNLRFKEFIVKKCGITEIGDVDIG